MKEKIHLVLIVALGIIIGFGGCYEIYNIHQDHETLSAVVTFINQGIAAQQKQQAPVQGVAPTK